MEWKDIVEAITPRLPQLELQFLLSKTHGFTPPDVLVTAATSGKISIDLQRGEFYWWTANDQPYDFCVSHMLHARSDAAFLPGHRFLGSNITPSAGMSEDAGEVVGLSLMTQYCGSTWFSPLKGSSYPGIGAPGGTLKFKKCKKNKKGEWKQGPDYLSAPFDPGTADPGDGLYALELKARKPKTKFAHAQFDKWRDQATNIRATQNGARRGIKSWITCFNYSCRDDKKSPEASALLVEDPWTESANVPPFDMNTGKGDWIIREHLARVATKVGAPQLEAGVLQGPVARPTHLPTLFMVDHASQRGRYFLGMWMVMGAEGILRPSCRSSNIDEVLRARFVRRNGRLALIDLEPVREVFVGLDAAMVAACLKCAPGEPISRYFPEEPEEISQILEIDTEQALVMAIRNGAVLATGNIVKQVPDEVWKNLIRQG